MEAYRSRCLEVAVTCSNLHQRNGGESVDTDEKPGWFSYALLWFLAVVTLSCFAGVIVAYVNA